MNNATDFSTITTPSLPSRVRKMESGDGVSAADTHTRDGLDQGLLRFHSTQPTPVRPSAVVTAAHARGK
jgi:hypothetical protein